MVYLLILAVAGLAFYFFLKKKQKKIDPASLEFVNDQLLASHIAYYRGLDDQGKTDFQKRVRDFLSTIIITGVDTGVNDTDRLMVAASAVIPVFAFPGWFYPDLKEVLVYSDAINAEFSSSGEGRNILGMVGTGYMDGKMLLSKNALQQGFLNSSDKANTTVHEFVHLVDKMDGDIDGVPKIILSQQYIQPWMELMKQHILEISKGHSDINPYGMTNEAEFLAVVAEYFFERPDLMKSKHPGLYQLLEEMFRQEPGKIINN